MTSPSNGETPRERLARLMDERRADLGLRWQDVAEAAGLTTEGLRGVRYGTGEIRILTKKGLESALQLERGSIDAALAGGDLRPALVDDGPGKAEPTTAELAEMVNTLQQQVQDLQERLRRMDDSEDQQRGAG